MNKLDHLQTIGVGDGHANKPPSSEPVTEVMHDPGFDAEQLPELWQQITGPHGIVGIGHLARWRLGVEAMYRRCGTFPQYAKIAAVLAGLPPLAWHNPKTEPRLGDMLGRATPEQLLQALIFENQWPRGSWRASELILTEAAVEQLTGPVVEQLPWHRWILVWGSYPPVDSGDIALLSHISEHIQKHLLGGDKHTWEMFLEIVEEGTPIGETAELVVAINQQHRPSLSV